jgi:DNA-binding transcriptional ArsR family regulator
MVTYIAPDYIMRRDVYQAIADPIRRDIIGLLAGRSLNLNAVAENFEVSRPAISKHIKILVECGLVEVSRIGREHVCTARLNKLREVSKWVDKYEVFWKKKLDALSSYLEEEQNVHSFKSKGKEKSSSKK